MVEDYLSDREQEEALRNWWRENWRWLLGGVLLGVALLAGWFYWQDVRNERALRAGKLYEDVQAAVGRNDIAGADKALAELAAKFDTSAYAQQARLLLAKAHVDASRYDDAVPLLRSVGEKSKDQELGMVAQLRLARILIQQNKADEALALLKPEELGGFAATGREIRGDALLSKGDTAGARAEYAAALAGDDAAASIDRSIVELKLQDVGGAPETKTDAAAAPPADAKPAAGSPPASP